MSKRSQKYSTERSKNDKAYFACDETEVVGDRTGKFCNAKIFPLKRRKTKKVIKVLDACDPETYKFMEANSMILIDQDEVL